jgi:hypothetical protein
VAASRLHRLLSRPSGAKAIALVREPGIEDRRERLRKCLPDQPIQRRRHPQHPRAPGGLGDLHPPDGQGPVAARVQRGLDLRPMATKPSPELIGPHPVDAWGTGVLLDASERRGEVVAGENPLPQARHGGVSFPVRGRRPVAALSTGSLGLHPRHPLHRAPSRGWLRSSRPARAPWSAARLRVRSFTAKRSRPLIRPLLTPGKRPSTSRRTGSGDTRRGRHPTRSPGISQPTFPAHPPHLRDGPSMTTGLATACWLARAAPPPMRFASLGSRFRLQLPPHPASQRRSCPRLVVSVI